MTHSLLEVPINHYRPLSEVLEVHDDKRLAETHSVRALCDCTDRTQYPILATKRRYIFTLSKRDRKSIKKKKVVEQKENILSV